MTGCALSMPRAHAGPSHEVTPADRLALVRRAKVWEPTRIAEIDVAKGPLLHGFAPEAEVACDYAEVTYGGSTPKFGCALSPKDVVKVRYGRDNGELYAGVAATRLLWLLGFGADAMYPVQIDCRGCPQAYASEGTVEAGGIRFDRASIERPFGGHKIDAAGDGGGWAWRELDLVDPAAGGAPLAQRDALKLVAVLLQHSDSKAVQQRLVCRDGGHDLAGCEDPFLMIHDVGETFGRANVFNRAAVGSVNFDLWSKTPIWKDAGRCVGNLAPSETGTLSNPVISEEGRAFLAGLLAQMTDAQIHDLFSVARFDRKPNGAAPIEAWVGAFKEKRAEIATGHCPS
jgi:hypothetical protein